MFDARRPDSDRPPETTSGDTAKTIAIVTVIAFVLSIGAVWATGQIVDRPEPALQDLDAAPAGEGRKVSEFERFWKRDNGVTSMVSPPPAEYELPDIPESRRLWYAESDGTETWGYASDAPARDVGIAVLEFYRSQGDWELGSSETLDLAGNAWGGTVYRRRTQEVVSVIAIPERLGESSGQNTTRVSVMRMAGEGVLRDFLGAIPEEQ